MYSQTRCRARMWIVPLDSIIQMSINPGDSVCNNATLDWELKGHPGVAWWHRPETSTQESETGESHVLKSAWEIWLWLKTRKPPIRGYVRRGWDASGPLAFVLTHRTANTKPFGHHSVFNQNHSALNTYTCPDLQWRLHVEIPLHNTLRLTSCCLYKCTT